MPKEKFVIEGLSGKRELAGAIDVRGSKNAALPMMASAMLFSDGLNLENVPMIEDVFRMSELLSALGVLVKVKKSSVSIEARGIKETDLNEGLSKRMRASIFLIGPILARSGQVSFPHPGGCVIGGRPIDIFLENFQKMGASLEEKNGHYILKTKSKKLKGTEIFFPIQSVSATETFMMAAVLAEGKTILKNVSLEPEIVASGEFLNSCGAKIKGLGTMTLEIEGDGLLKSDSRKFKVIPDRLETGGFLILGALSAKRLLIKNCNPAHIEILIETLRKAGVNIKTSKSTIEIIEEKSASSFESVNIKTHEYPGFPTDLQAPISVFLTQTKGESVVFETIFESRLNYTEDLVKMGADITMWDPHRVMIKGPTKLKGRELEGPDIRAGLAFLIAAIVARGHSVINNIYYIDRGYERIEERLQKIGVNIKRVKSEI